MHSPNTAAAFDDTTAPLTLVASRSEHDLAFATTVVASFLRNLQALCADIDPSLPSEARASIFRKLNHFLCSGIRGFSKSFNTPMAEGGRPRITVSPKNGLRYFCKQVVPYDIQQVCRRNPVILEMYKMLFIPHDSRVLCSFKDAGKHIAQVLPPVMVTGLKELVSLLRSSYDVQKLAGMSPEAITAMARRIVEEDRERFVKALEEVAHFNGEPAAKKCVFVSAIFPTTWAPTVRALNDNGWFTAWLGTRNMQEFIGYGAIATKDIPVKAAYPSSFLGTIVFMAGASPQSRVLLNGESYYGANWNGEDALILYLLTNAVTNAIKETRAPESNNLFFLMYDGLKPVARSREMKNDISKFYRGFMQSPDKIIYNSNLDLFGEYVENTYGATQPRHHFMRFSEPPKNPKPMLDFGPNGDEFHMACITVCLNEFEEPSRESGPTFVRSMIEQGIHFHYYCMPEDAAIARFRNSIKPEFQKYFHAHPINKDQQSLVDDLCQYHVAFNPADHMPFAAGITTVSDRSYQDGMATFWQSTVGTSFLVYAAAGLPSILPRGCTAAVELLKDTAVPVYLSELKNIKAHLEKIGLRETRMKLAKGSPIGWVDTHIQGFIDFIN